jgi:Flp pilus assembly pilin Flp
MRRLLCVLVHDERGQDLIEYGLLASFISLVAVVIITNLGTSVNGMYGVIEGQVQAIPGGGS